MVTITLDDTWYYIDIDDESIKSANMHEFYEVIDILLTDKQRYQFTGNDTKREFKVSQKKIDKVLKYINSPENIWRKKPTN